jgi:hypothetical protein
MSLPNFTLFSRFAQNLDELIGVYIITWLADCIFFWHNATPNDHITEIGTPSRRGARILVVGGGKCLPDRTHQVAQCLRCSYPLMFVDYRVEGSGAKDSKLIGGVCRIELL